MRVAFAGDRDLAVQVLDHLLDRGERPVALLVAGPPGASHAEELRARCAHLDDGDVFAGPQGLRAGIDRLAALDLDYLLSVHYPHLVPAEALALPRIAALNLHPAYLPYNRGWHTPTWALLDGSPIGATLHVMVEEVDAGAIVHRRRLEPSPGDTAHSLYGRLKALELDVFREAWPDLAEGRLVTSVPDEAGSWHRRADLFDPAVQRIDLDAPTTAGAVLRHLRALTTDRWDEAAWFEADGRRFRVRVDVAPDPPDGGRPETPGGPPDR